jgi:hypothetical protein
MRGIISGYVDAHVAKRKYYLSRMFFEAILGLVDVCRGAH